MPPPAAATQSFGPLTLSGSDLYDWFRIYLTAGIQVKFHTTGGSGDNYVELFDSAWTRLASDDNGAGEGQFGLAFTPLVSGHHCLRVRAGTLGSACAYSLQYNTIPEDPYLDPWDPMDNSFERANLLPDPTDTVRKFGKFKMSGHDTYDWFKVYLRAGTAVNFTFDSYGRQVLDLLDASTGQTVKSASGSKIKLSYMVMKSGYYDLRVGPYYPNNYTESLLSD